uniref:Pyruvate formate lyase family protein n=1 Tax=Desertifilum tharense IPPAS B-1220 TaxID=1781255 RepID=A0ACD5H197_9CYAN
MLRFCDANWQANAIFRTRANLAKALLYAINGGKDEKSGEQIAPAFAPITAEYLDYDEVVAQV